MYLGYGLEADSGVLDRLFVFIFGGAEEEGTVPGEDKHDPAIGSFGEEKALVHVLSCYFAV